MSSLRRLEKTIEVSDRNNHADTPSIGDSHYESLHNLIGPGQYELSALGF
jgi:hypothetical protein